MIKKLLKDIDTLNQKSKFSLNFYSSGGFIEFYNTSEKVFALGLKSVIAIFEDILKNRSEFADSENYNEKEWRDLASEYYTDGAANAIATVQTKPLFASLSKFVVIANNDLDAYNDGFLSLEKGKLEETINYLNKLVGLFKVDIETEAGEEDDNTTDLKAEFAQWLVDNQKSHYFYDDIIKTIKGLELYQKHYEEEFQTRLFEIDFSKLSDEIEVIEQNIWKQDSAFFNFSDKTSNHQPRAILGSKNYLKFLQEYQIPAEIAEEVTPGYNKIYFGAPGTGKSYAVAQLLKENKVRESNIERVTFHPDYDYSSFIGGYKPVTETDEQGNESVKYKFVPQVFVNIYEKAWRNPRQNYYLVIEEINRGNCAEIFGDIFQLLDRNPDYTITPSEDLFKYLNKRNEFSANKSLLHGKLAMPDNLIILATMNTSDQSLYPMDSAFKRRWDWEYVPVKYPVNDADNSCPSFGYKITLDDNHYINWIDFVKNINGHIMQNPSLGMDKCLGNFFLKPDVKGEISIDMVINKVMFYLWNDVFKDEENEIFSGHSYNDYFPIATNGRAQLRALSDKHELIRKIVVVTAREAISVAGEETIS